MKARLTVGPRGRLLLARWRRASGCAASNSPRQVPGGISPRATGELGWRRRRRPRKAKAKCQAPPIVWTPDPRPCTGAISTPNFRRCSRIESGDTVVISTVSGGREVMPPPPLVVPAALSRHAGRAPAQASGPHLHRAGGRQGRQARSGPRGAHQGRSTLNYDWGYNFSGPLTGALPDDFAERHLMHIALDRHRMTGRLPWGTGVAACGRSSA